MKYVYYCVEYVEVVQSTTPSVARWHGISKYRQKDTIYTVAIPSRPFFVVVQWISDDPQKKSGKSVVPRAIVVAVAVLLIVK